MAVKKTAADELADELKKCIENDRGVGEPKGPGPREPLTEDLASADQQPGGNHADCRRSTPAQLMHRAAPKD
jgi:hypothetical protein